MLNKENFLITLIKSVYNLKTKNNFNGRNKNSFKKSTVLSSEEVENKM